MEETSDERAAVAQRFSGRTALIAEPDDGAPKNQRASFRTWLNSGRNQQSTPMAGVIEHI